MDNSDSNQKLSKDYEVDSTNNAAHRKGIHFDEMVDYYSEWARSGDYDKDLSQERYRGPMYAAEGLAEQVPESERGSFLVLDIGAGTGFVGEELKKKGFSQMDGLEPAIGMLEEARKRGVYSQLHHMGIGIEPVPIQDDHYNALVCSGAFGEGHVPCIALKEFIRLVKPGGLVVIMMRERYLEEVEEYRGRMEPFMKKLQVAGAWDCIRREVKPRYSFNNNGVRFIYRVNIQGTVDVNMD